MSKKLLLVALAAVAVVSTAFGQGAKNAAPGSKAEKFYQVVPEHEFLINGFGGMSTMLYKANLGYDEPSEVGMVPPLRYQKADIVNFSNEPFHPTGIGGGGGFGYIWHFHPNVGLMTGIDVAYYSSGIRNICGAQRFDGREPYYSDRPFFTSYVVDEIEEKEGEKYVEKYLVTYGVRDYTEMQKYLALQIPIMFQFMAPMGRGNNHFYAALGARIGFGVWNQYKGKGAMLFSSYGRGWLPYSPTWVDNPQLPDPGFYTDFDGGDNWEPEGNFPWWKGGYYTEDEHTQDLIWHDGEDEEHPFQPSGKWGAKLVNVMASAEIGFRWGLGKGWGLYTGLYCDFGILPVNKKMNVALMTGYEGMYGWEQDSKKPDYEPHSIMNTQTTPGVRIKEEEATATTDPKRKYMYDPLNPTVRAHTLGAGLKLKLASRSLTL